MDLAGQSAGSERQPEGERWVRLTSDQLELGRAWQWVSCPQAGAVVVFAGTVRDHAEGRPGVIEVEYEAYLTQVEPRLEAIEASARKSWPELARVLLWHRFGTLGVGEVSVLVAVSAPHRAEAFAAARYCIDTLKKTVPIWKRERWSGGEDWGLDASELSELKP